MKQKSKRQEEQEEYHYPFACLYCNKPLTSLTDGIMHNCPKKPAKIKIKKS